MTLTVDVTFSEDVEAADDEVPEPELLRTWATASYLKHTEDAADAIVSVLVSSLQEIQQLNKQYREKDKATNVLSFPMRLPDEVGPAVKIGPCSLGTYGHTRYAAPAGI